MERHVVLSHKLIQIDVRILFGNPPFLELVGVGFQYRHVPDGRVEPHVEHFISEALQRHGHTPLQISGNATGLEALSQPCPSYDLRIVRPIRRRLLHPVVK